LGKTKFKIKLKLMEIYKDLSNPASKEFEKLLNSQLSKIKY
jgi:small subunit ribosomal protein S1